MVTSYIFDVIASNLPVLNGAYPLHVRLIPVHRGCLVDGSVAGRGWQRSICDHTLQPLVFKAVDNDLRRLGGASMMTEGMACNGPNRSDYDECVGVLNGR
jgi:hypothetical protein